MCPFCRDRSDGPWIGETARLCAVGSIDPAMPRAALLVPRRHVETPFDLTPEEAAEIPEGLRMIGAWLPAEGYTVGWNVGSIAGQTVAHVHLHVIARGAEAIPGRGLRAVLKDHRVGR